MEHPSLELHTIPNSQILTLVDHLFRSHHRYLAIPRNRLRSLQTLLNQLLPASKRPCSNPPLHSFLPTESLPRQNQLHSSRLPNRSRKPLTSSSSWNRPKFN